MKLILAVLIAVPVWAQTAVFPSAVVTDAQLKVARDRAQTNLNVALNSTATSINVVSGSKFAANAIITIENEQISVCDVVGNTLTVGHSSCPNIDGRGFNGTAAVGHANNSLVSAYMTAWNYNAQNAEIKAIQGALGPNLSNVVSLITTTPSNGANKALSNLSTGTAVNQDLLPDGVAPRNLGGLAKPWNAAVISTPGLMSTAAWGYGGDFRLGTLTVPPNTMRYQLNNCCGWASSNYNTNEYAISGATEIPDNAGGIEHGGIASVVFNKAGKKTITGGSWSGGVATLTLSAHNYQPGIMVLISGVTPSGYNGTYQITAVTTYTISYALISNPGAFVSGGTVFSQINGVALSGFTGARANGTTNFGLNLLVSDTTYSSSGIVSAVDNTTVVGAEFDFNMNGANWNVTGLSFGGASSQPTGTNAAYYVMFHPLGTDSGTGDGIPATLGLWSMAGAIGNTYPAIRLDAAGPCAAGGCVSKNSQKLQFNAANGSGGNESWTLVVDSAGNSTNSSDGPIYMQITGVHHGGVPRNVARFDYSGLVIESVGSLTLQALGGTGAKCLEIDNAGVVGKAAAACGTGGSGANTTLSNLGTTAINDHLIPASSATKDLGSVSVSWRNIFTESVQALAGLEVLANTGSAVGIGAGGANQLTVDAGAVSVLSVPFRPRQVAYASLGSAATAGNLVFCTNCQSGTGTTCASGGSGALAYTNGTNWICN